jgi:16S rRNA (guanine966-N2)-methyltransferase
MRMRIIAGQLGGQWFKADVGGRTHPFAERIRGSLFNSLGDITGMTVLDAFSGTGACAFEAASRGARSVIAIERDRKAQKSIKNDLEALKLAETVKLINASCGAWSANNPTAQFDIVICDPPYNDLQLGAIAKLTRHIKADGRMVVSYPGKETTPEIDGAALVNDKNYGDAALAFYRKT